MTKATTKTRKAPAKKLTAAQADKITMSKGIGTDGAKHLVKSAGGQELTIPTARWSGEVRELSRVGGSFKALEAAWNKASTAKLARGVGSRDAPHSSKSVADSAAKSKAAAPKKQTAKAKAAAKKAAAAEADTRKLALTEKGEAKLAKLSAADRKKDRLQLMADAGTVEKALALPGVGRGDVNYAIRTGVLAAK